MNSRSYFSKNYYKVQYNLITLLLNTALSMVWFHKISILSPQKGLEIPGGQGFPKTKRFKEMYEVELEFPVGWGALLKNLFRGVGMDIFWNFTLSIQTEKYKVNFVLVIYLILSIINQGSKLTFSFGSQLATNGKNLVARS